MRSSKTFGVQFIIRRNKLKNGLVPIYARITVDSERVEISMKKRIKVTNWNELGGRAKGNAMEVKKLNHYLEQFRSGITNSYQQMQIEKKLITAEALKNMALGLDEDGHTITRLVDYHNTNFKNVLSDGTLKNYFTTKKYILRYLKKRYRKSDMYLSELTYKFITEFELYLRAYQPTDHQKPLSNNGVMKHLERLRKLIRLAVRLEWMAKDPFERYQLKFNKVERGFLDQDELIRLQDKKFEIARLDWVRDLFVFSCYTGLAYIDVMKLAPENLGKGVDGKLWIMTTRQKTQQKVSIPILPKAMDIISKYKEHPRAEINGTLFPVISNQKLNSYLKEIADLCRIRKNLTFHLARHTFATTVTLSNGVPIESVSKMLGHTKITTTQIYAKVVEHKVSEDMGMLREKLFQA
ncbi:site-specific integrase [Fulvivirga ligni]|uniref:site-specific integrase n=1 Tax=Fulvivirga ligni TaxID=2904246 RepID=UPI001F21A12A|nr:site-specific integrase [Fulvivirga ligni]UII21670.1 site-specific integrase [Fulvivirga ligni]